MAKKKNNKQRDDQVLDEFKDVVDNGSTGYIIIIILLLVISLGLGGYICYDKFISGKDVVKKVDKTKIEERKKEAEEKQEDTLLENIDVDVKDKYVYGIDVNENATYYLMILINNGRLYGIHREIKNYDYSYGFLEMNDDNTKSLIEIKDIKNVNRIKGVNTISNDTSLNTLAITEDGSVYSITYNNENSKFDVERFKPLEKLKVADILYLDKCNASECDIKYEVKLLDGSIKSNK